MVQINEPRMVRRHLLESLREIILFMQGYEKFRRIQDEKVSQFLILKGHVKELNRMTDQNLKGYLPAGKLQPITKEQSIRKEQEEIRVAASVQPRVLPQAAFSGGTAPVARPQPVAMAPRPAVLPEQSELDELERQLSDIESQLRNIK